MAGLIGPNQVEFIYRVPSTPTREHALRFNVIVNGTPPNGLPMTSYNMLKKGGGAVAADVGINLLWSFIRQFYPSTAQCVETTLWKVSSGTSERTFMSSMSVTNPQGSGVGSFQPMQQQTLTFRSANGGIQKVILLESIFSGGETRNGLIANAAGTAAEKLASYMLSADNITIAVDDSFIISPLRQTTGQNEHIAKKVKYG